MKPGSLWPAVLETTEDALRLGALERIPTRMVMVDDSGVRFQAHLVQQLQRKARARIAQRHTGANPFLPYEPAMFVADVSDHHVCLLNKFNVMDHHLLIVTREFEDQETLLTASDFEAMWRCMGEFDSLAFYNSGEIAGASQPHKHLQLVPLPLGGGTEHTPMDSLVEATGPHAGLGTIEAFPFSHSIAPVSDLANRPLTEAALETEALYREMVGVWVEAAAPKPYNLLVTRDWMLFVPRSVEKHGPISVNALGYAGSLLARNEEELDLIRQRGPMGILEDVGISP